jgi:hypothetical protein
VNHAVDGSKDGGECGNGSSQHQHRYKLLKKATHENINLLE